MLSETEAGLQSKLNALENYCNINKLSVNTKKTQCMIFNKTGRLLKNYKFTYKNAPLECVREYKYLGFIVTPSGEVRTGLEDLRQRAVKAYYKLKNTLGAMFQKDIENTIHLYNYLVKPILTYCSDFWVCLQPKNNPIEKIHLMFCKHLLGVRKQTCTDGVLQEIGLTPLTLFAIQSATKNWERIQQGKANALLIASNNYSRKENLPWALNIKSLFSSSGLLEQYLQKINETEERRYGPITYKLIRRLTDIFHQTAFEAINTGSKMKTLNLLKKAPGREPYLKEVTNIKHRKALTKLRLSAHRLEIETGRYSDTLAENRFCVHCQSKGRDVVEDEIHFLINCPMYRNLREIMLPSQVLNNQNMTDQQKFVEIMTNHDAKITGKFVYQAFNERDINLDVLSVLNELVSSVEISLKNKKPAQLQGPGQPDNYQVKWLSGDGLKIILSKVNNL